MTEETKLQVTDPVGRNKDKGQDGGPVLSAVQGQQPAGDQRAVFREKFLKDAVTQAPHRPTVLESSLPTLHLILYSFPSHRTTAFLTQFSEYQICMK